MVTTLASGSISNSRAPAGTAARGALVAGPGAGGSGRLGAQPASAAPATAANRSAGHRFGPGPFGLPRQPRPAGCVSIEWLPYSKDPSRMLRNTPSSYGSVAKLLHWSIVVLIITQLVLGISADDLPNGLRKLELLAWHKSFGMLILMLALLRLAWRYANPRPVPPADMPRWQRLAAVGTHRLLYALILLQPLTGWLMSSYKNYPVSFFGLFQWPDLVAPDAGMHELFEEVHEWLARLLVTVAIIHASAALYHHFGRRDDVLRRMLPFTGAVAAAASDRGKRPGGDRLAYGRGGQPTGVPRHAGRRGIRGPLQALRAGDPRSTLPTWPAVVSWSRSTRARPIRRTAIATRRLRAATSSPRTAGRRRSSRRRRFAAKGAGQVRGPGPPHDPRRDAGCAAAVHVHPGGRWPARDARGRYHHPEARLRCRPGRMDRHDLGRQRGQDPLRAPACFGPQRALILRCSKAGFTPPLGTRAFRA